MTEIMTTVFIEQLLASPGSAKEAKHLFKQNKKSIYLSSHEPKALTEYSFYQEYAQ